MPRKIRSVLNEKRFTNHGAKKVGSVLRESSSAMITLYSAPESRIV